MCYRVQLNCHNLSVYLAALRLYPSLEARNVHAATIVISLRTFQEGHHRWFLTCSSLSAQNVISRSWADPFPHTSFGGRVSRNFRPTTATKIHYARTHTTNCTYTKLPRATSKKRELLTPWSYIWYQYMWTYTYITLVIHTYLNKRFSHEEKNAPTGLLCGVYVLCIHILTVPPKGRWKVHLGQKRHSKTSSRYQWISAYNSKTANDIFAGQRQVQSTIHVLRFRRWNGAQFRVKGME